MLCHRSTYPVRLSFPISTYQSPQVSRHRHRFSSLLHITRITAGECECFNVFQACFNIMQDNNTAKHHFTTEGAVSGSFAICFWTKWKWDHKENIDCSSHSISCSKMLWLCFKSISFALSRSEMHDCIYHNLVRFFSVPSAQYTCQCHVVGIVKLLTDDCRIQFVIYFFCCCCTPGTYFSGSVRIDVVYADLKRYDFD